MEERERLEKRNKFIPYYRVIMNAAKFAVYIAKNTTANIAQTLVINRAVNPRGESTFTAA